MMTVPDPNSLSMQWLNRMIQLDHAPQPEQQAHIQAGLQSTDLETRKTAQNFIAGLERQVSEMDNDDH